MKPCLPNIVRGPIIMLLLALLCLLCACNAQTDTQADHGIAPADVISGYPIIFKQVYCTGDNNDTPVRYSFIELYNTSARPISLDGIYIGYAKGDRDSYAPYALPAGAEIAPHASYLIRCAQAVSETGELYIDACEKFTLSHYDADMPNLRLSSKRCRLILTNSAKAVKQSALKSGTVLAYFGAYSADANVPFPYPANCDTLNKHTAVLRTDDNSAWTTVNYAEQTCMTVTDYTPSYSGGKLTEIPLSAVQVFASVEGGRYSENVSVTLTTLPGYDIVFTREFGKSPRTFDYYSGGPIHISDTFDEQLGTTTSLLMQTLGQQVPPLSEPLIGAAVLRACATDGKSYGPIMTETYFVAQDMSAYDDILLLNITLDPDAFVGSDGIYSTINDHVFDERRPCEGYMEIFGENGTNPDDHYVYLKMNGNGSLAWNQKSMRVSVRESQTAQSGATLEYDLFAGDAVDASGAEITEFDTFVLRNSGNDSSHAHFRDALMHRLSKDVNACIQAYRPSLLFINGEFWGLYNIRERYSPDYFYRHFGIEPENLVMLETISPLLTGSWNTPYALNDGEPGDEQDFYAITDYVASHSMKNDDEIAWVEERMDLDNFIDFFLASCYLANTDWPGNNIKVWRNKNPADPSGMDTRCRWVLSDMDFGIGDSTHAEQPMFHHALTEDTVCGKLMTRMLNNTRFRLRFADRACALVNEVYIKDSMLTELYLTADKIEPFIGLHFIRWQKDGGSMEFWQEHIGRADAFLSDRTAYFMRELGEMTHASISTLTCTPNEQARLYLSSEPASAGADNARVTDLEILGHTLYFRDSTPITIRAVPADGYKVIGFSCKIGPREEQFSGDTLSFSLLAKSTVTVLTEKIDP